MSTQQMIDSGKKQIKEVDSALKRSEKVVEDTIAIATNTAETLHKQTEQLERTLDSLDEVHFTLKKAKQVIRDITRGIATDKCVTISASHLHDDTSARQT
jgi:novel plant SNARE